MYLDIKAINFFEKSRQKVAKIDLEYIEKQSIFLLVRSKKAPFFLEKSYDLYHN